MLTFIKRHPWGRISLVALAALALAGPMGCDSGSSTRSGTNASDADPSDGTGPFFFTRTSRHILRLDSTNGKVWLVPISGDGGWVRLGSTPTPAGMPNHDQRYGLFMLEKGKSGTVTLLRIDKATGRAWVAKSSDSDEWIPIDEVEDPPLEGGLDAEPEPEAAARPNADANKEANTASKTPQGPDTEVLEIIPAERFGQTAEEQNANITVIMEALYKEGLPVEIKVWGAQQLAVLLPEVAVPVLVETLDHESPEVVVAAITSLQAIGDPATIPRIIAMQNHPDARVREAAQAVIVQSR
jgi:hypothetical protein